MQNTIPQLKLKITRLVGGLLFAVILISAWSIYAQYHSAIDFAERQAEDYARALTEHGDSAFADADRIMRDTLHDLKNSGGIDRLNQQALFVILQQAAEGAPQVGSLFVTDKRGNMLANSNIFPQPPVNVADRDYFNHYLNTIGANLVISDTIMGRLVARWRFNLVRPMLDAANSFNGIVSVAIEADYFNKFMGPSSLGNRGRVLFIRDDGTPLVSEPYETNAYKANFSSSNLFKTKLPASQSGVYHDSLGNNDNASRIIAYRHLNSFPVVAIVALHKGDVLGPWAWKALFQSTITIGLCIVVIILTKLMFRHLDSLDSAQTTVGELEEELLQLQKVEALGQMAGGISHDFNNLLTPILVYAEMIRRGLPKEHRQLRRVDGIIEAANKARDLNHKLMSIGRKQPLCLEHIDLNRFVASFRDAIRTMLPKNIAFNLHLASEPTLVRADRTQLEQVFMNLATNARDAIEGNGIITMTTSRFLANDEFVKTHPGITPGHYMLVELKDDGRGMDEETLGHVYEPFFTTKKSGLGAGLGLATTYGIIKQHGGYVRILSNAGEGTSVLVYLPVAAEDTSAITVSSVAINSPDLMSAATILLVEDDAMVREMAIDLLESEGFTVMVADSPKKARELESTFNGTIDLLLTDVVMPEINGVELYEQLRYKRPDMPVLYISGYTSDAEANSGKLGSAANFLRKPFTVEQFTDKVKHAISTIK